MRGFNFHHVSQNATPAPELARCHHFTQPQQCDSQKTRIATCPKCCAWRSPKCAPATKSATRLLKMTQKFCACHIKRLSTRYETRGNVTKVPREYAMFGTSYCCRTRHRHGHTALTRTLADGCEPLGTVAHGLANTASTPKPPV